MTWRNVLKASNITGFPYRRVTIVKIRRCNKSRISLNIRTDAFYYNLQNKSFLYTGCPRRNVPDFERVFLMLKYTDITQNTYVQSWTVTEIMAREKCGLLAGPRTVPVSWQLYLCYVVQCGIILYHITAIQLTLAMYFLQGDDVISRVTPVLDRQVSCIVLGTLRTTMTRVRVFL